jgi:hypothetical protein
VKYRKRSWGLPSITYCELGRGDFCVANKKGFERYCWKHPDTGLVSIGSVCFSMGGRNLAILTRADSKYAQVNMANRDEGLRGAQITVGLDTDRFRGLMTTLGVGQDWFAAHDVELIDIADPHLQVFDMNKDAIVVAGQNVRLEAAERGDFVELFPLMTLSRETQRELLANSENVLLARRGFLEDYGIDPTDLFSRLMSNFNSWSMGERLDEFVEDLADECRFDSDDPEVREKLMRITLYETYRFGMPTLL